MLARGGAAPVSGRYVGQMSEFALRIRDSDNSDMTAAGKHIVDHFESLPDAEKREVLAILLRISSSIQYPEISDEELLASANTVFLEYDQQESNE
jgi:hypothetical protein